MKYCLFQSSRHSAAPQLTVSKVDWGAARARLQGQRDALYLGTSLRDFNFPVGPAGDPVVPSTSVWAEGNSV